MESIVGGRKGAVGAKKVRRGGRGGDGRGELARTRVEGRGRKRPTWPKSERGRKGGEADRKGGEKKSSRLPPSPNPPLPLLLGREGGGDGGGGSYHVINLGAKNSGTLLLPLLPPRHKKKLRGGKGRRRVGRNARLGMQQEEME